MQKFRAALRDVLRISKDDLDQMLADEKKANQSKRGSKPSSSSASAYASENED